MGSSSERKKRQALIEEGAHKKQLAKKEKMEKEAKRRRNYTIGGIIIALFVVVVVFLNSNLFYTVLPAVKVGDKNYTTAEYNYFYNISYLNFLNTYGDYVSYFLDTSKPLDEQMYDEETTWAEYFRSTALESMRRMTAVSDAAEAAEFALSDERKGEIDASLAQFAEYAEGYGYTSVKQYLTAVYGKGCSEKMVEELMLLSALASDYSETIYDGFSYTDDNLETYYQENKDKFDIISYSYYFISGAADEANGIDAETAMKNAKETAEAIVAETTDEVSFTEAVYEKADGAAPVTSSDDGASLGADYSEWLLSKDRKSGDSSVIETENGCYAILFTAREDNHYKMAAVRHILIEAQADENGEYTQEALDTAKEKADEVYDEWSSGTATEDSFAELALKYSTDSGSNENGGLYENIFKGQMVEEFDEFCFEGHETGDTAIVFGESSGYAGYHLVYYVGEGDLYSTYIADQYMRNEDYTAWEDSIVENYEAKTKLAIVFGE